MTRPTTRPLTLLGVLLAVGCAGPVAERRASWVGAPLQAEREETAPEPLGALTFTLENDSLVGEDSAYTNGFGLSWTSRDVSQDRDGGFFASTAEWLEFLPEVNEGPTFVTLTLGQEIFTPDDIQDPTPDPDDQPYAGALFLDLSVDARDGDDLHSYKIRGGVVGPESQAEYVQKRVHNWFDFDRPAGWDFQLETELLLNVYYEYHHRITLSEPEDEWQLDTTPHAGVALGTYSNAVSAGVLTRFGETLPDTVGRSALNAGTNSKNTLSGPARDDGYLFGFVDLTAFGVARFTPLDGNAFRDSRSVNSEPLVGEATLGFVYGAGAWVSSLSFSFLTETFEGADGSPKFGSVSISRFF